MCQYNKMKHKQRGKLRNLSDNFVTILFTLFIFTLCLLMFSYADNLSHNREGYFRTRRRGIDEFAVKNYTWKCQNQKCVRFLAQNEYTISLDTCNMLCWQPPLWPKPRNVTVTNQTYSTIHVEKINFDLPQGPANVLLQNATDLFVQNLNTTFQHQQGTTLTVHIVLQLGNITRLQLATNESYKLLVQKEGKEVAAYISAENYFGARNGLETLSQLIWYDEVEVCLKILHDVDVEDSPQFPYRGVMIDTARNFFPLSKIRKIVDGMAMSKLNVLHLHLTDAASFPVVLPSVKELAEYGAYGPDKIYTAQDIKDLVQFARIRGVRVLLEVDAPSHVSAGWNYANDLFAEDYVICNEKDFFNGHLNPDNDNVLNALQSVYTDILELMEDNELFHLGSDEVNLDCWSSTKAARNFSNMKDFWVSYINKMLQRLKKVNQGTYPAKIILWASPLTEYQHFDQVDGNVVVQFWFGRPQNFLQLGHQVIYSTVGHWYLDCGFGPWKPDMRRGNCDPYTPWQTFYKYKPWEDYGYRNLVLGGEVCLWSEQVEVDNLETRVWPRSAAFAERMWTNPDTFNDYDVYTRLVSFRERLVWRGIRNAGLWPRWCSQNPGRC